MARKCEIIAQKGESLKFEVNSDKCDTSILGSTFMYLFVKVSMCARARLLEANAF